MNSLPLEKVTSYVEENISGFHAKRAEALVALKLPRILKRKNPYLFRAKNLLTAQDLVKSILDAHLSSQEETLFGDFLEQLAIYICGLVYGGAKSAAEGIDLEFDRDGTKYIVSIKSGPHWGNSQQIARMKDNFRRAKRVLRTSGHGAEVVAVNGCCYGRDDRFDKEEYLKLCGQRFWEFISGNPSLYVDIVEPLGHRAKEKNEDFMERYAQILNRFTLEFTNEFCTPNGGIDWARLVAFNSEGKKEAA